MTREVLVQLYAHVLSLCFAWVCIILGGVPNILATPFIHTRPPFCITHSSARQPVITFLTVLTIILNKSKHQKSRNVRRHVRLYTREWRSEWISEDPRNLWPQLSMCFFFIWRGGAAFQSYFWDLRKDATFVTNASWVCPWFSVPFEWL